VTLIYYKPNTNIKNDTSKAGAEEILLYILR